MNTDNQFKDIETFIRKTIVFHITKILRGSLLSQIELKINPLPFTGKGYKSIEIGDDQKTSTDILSNHTRFGCFHTGQLIRSNNYEQKIPLEFYIGNFVVYLYNMCMLHKISFNKDVWSKFFRGLVAHECTHVKQILWLKENSKNFAKSLDKLHNYQHNTPYLERVVEIEAYKSQNGLQTQPIEEYMSQFL